MDTAKNVTRFTKYRELQVSFTGNSSKCSSLKSATEHQEAIKKIKKETQMGNPLFTQDIIKVKENMQTIKESNTFFSQICSLLGSM